MTTSVVDLCSGSGDKLETTPVVAAEQRRSPERHGSRPARTVNGLDDRGGNHLRGIRETLACLRRQMLTASAHACA